MNEDPSGEALTGVLEQVLHHHFTHSLHGLLPSTINVHKLRQALDLNCRIGSWVIDLALSYPGTLATGLDNRPQFVAMARRNAAVGNLSRARFYEADLTKPLQFADSTFDLLHLSMSSVLFRPDEWPAFLAECMRVMKPGACINLLNVSAGPSSSEAFQRIVVLIDQILYKHGYNFSTYSGTTSPGVYLCRMLRESGFVDVTYTIHPINFGGWNNASGRACCQLILNDIKRARPIFLECQLTSAEEFDALIAQQEKDISDMYFCGTGAIISAVATKK
jgi:ubiquinone/menaquinone biosynthesis C-methylase UbiE